MRYDPASKTLLDTAGAAIGCVTLPTAPFTPPLVVGPTINKGQPTSLFDVLHNAPTGKRMVPKDGGVAALSGDPLPDHYNNPEAFEAVTVARLHKMIGEAPKGRGRPVAVPLELATKIKAARYKHKRSLASIAGECDLSIPTVRAIVQGKRLWYA